MGCGAATIGAACGASTTGVWWTGVESTTGTCTCGLGAADGIVGAAWEICGSVDVTGTDGTACVTPESGAPDSRPLLKLWASSVGEMFEVGGIAIGGGPGSELLEGVAGAIDDAESASEGGEGGRAKDALEGCGTGVVPVNELGTSCAGALRFALTMCARKPGVVPEPGEPGCGTNASVLRLPLLATFPRWPGPRLVAGRPRGSSAESAGVLRLLPPIPACAPGGVASEFLTSSAKRASLCCRNSWVASTPCACAN